MGIVGKIVLGEKGLLVEAEIAGDGANEASIENAAGQLVPVFIFEGFQEARANARRQGYFSGGTSRSSRSRFRRSPKFPLAMPLSVEMSLSVTATRANLGKRMGLVISRW